MALDSYTKKGKIVYPADFKVSPYSIRVTKKGDSYQLTQSTKTALTRERALDGVDVKTPINKSLQRANENGLNRTQTEEQLTETLKNTIKYDKLLNIKSTFNDDQMCQWLPSSADTPDLEHETNYYKKYPCSKGIKNEEGHYEIPGERFGCQCGFKVLS